MLVLFYTLLKTHKYFFKTFLSETFLLLVLKQIVTFFLFYLKPLLICFNHSYPIINLFIKPMI